VGDVSIDLGEEKGVCDSRHASSASCRGLVDPGDPFCTGYWVHLITSQTSDVGHASGNYAYSTTIQVVLI